MLTTGQRFFIPLFFLVISIAVGNADSNPSTENTQIPGKTFLTMNFEKFRTIDWGIGHDISLPLRDPNDISSFLTPRNDGGDWQPFYWDKSDQSRSGSSLELRIVNPADDIRGCGVDIYLRGKTALPPDRDITVTVWTNCSKNDDDFTDIVLGWQPGDFKGFMGGVQEYVQVSHRVRENGWKLQTLTFRSHKDPEVGDIIGLAFGAHTKRKTLFKKNPNPPKGANCVGLVAIQPVLSAYFDDLTITVADWHTRLGLL